MAHPGPERLQLYLDQRLSEWDRWAIDHHVAKCELCSEKLASLRELLSGLDSMKELSLSPDFAAEVVEEAAPSPHLEVAPARRWLVVQAAVCVIIFVTCGALLTIVDTPVTDPSDDVLGAIDVLLGSPFQTDANIVAVLAIMTLAGLGVLACVLGASPRVRPRRHDALPSRVPRRRG